MTGPARTSLLIVLFMEVINSFHLLVQFQYHKHIAWGGMYDFAEAVPYHIFFACMFWMTCQIKLKTPRSLRLPLIRIVFWTIMLLYGLRYNKLPLAEDFMHTINENLCFFYATIQYTLGKTNNILLANHYFFLFGIGIIGMALYEYIIISLAMFVNRKSTKGKPSLKQYFGCL